MILDQLSLFTEKADTTTTESSTITTPGDLAVHNELLRILLYTSINRYNSITRDRTIFTTRGQSTNTGTCLRFASFFHFQLIFIRHLYTAR